MPLWKVYHPVDAFSDADKQVLAEQITDLYTRLPRFYVGVLFFEVPKQSFFMGGKATDKFVRINIDHIAINNIPAERKAWWIENINRVLGPFVNDRGYSWEFHIDETLRDLWSIQGFVPPPANSEAENRWKAENKPTAYELLQST